MTMNWHVPLEIHDGGCCAELRALWHTGVLGRHKKMRRAWAANARHAMAIFVLMGDSAGVRDGQPFVFFLVGEPHLPEVQGEISKIWRVAARATSRILPDCSHWIHQDAAEDVNCLLKELTG